MKDCVDCEFKGYSPEFCQFHVRTCAKRNKGKIKKDSKYQKIAVGTLAGAGVGVAAAVVGSTAVSLVGGVALLHVLALKIGAGAGLAGGGIGFFKGLKDKRKSFELANGNSNELEIEQDLFVGGNE